VGSFLGDSPHSLIKNNVGRLTRRNTADQAWPGHCINCAAFKVQAENLRSSKRASAKIRTIVRLLQHIAKESGGEEKTVIFSQFTAMLDIIESFLMVIGIDFVRCEILMLQTQIFGRDADFFLLDDGKMSIKERIEALAEISTNPRKTVILVSLKAGGVGMSTSSPPFGINCTRRTYDLKDST
jgi:SNF2 family DNA or RNA helicase